MSQIKKVCERVIVLNRGRLSFDGPAEEAVEHYNALVDNPVWTDRKEVVTATKRGFALESPVEVKAVDLDEATHDKERNEVLVESGKNLHGHIVITSAIADLETKISISIRRNVLGGITTVIDHFEKVVRVQAGENRIPFSIEMKFMPPAMYQLDTFAEKNTDSKKYAKVIFKKKFAYGERSQFKTDKLVDLNIHLAD